jgi:hypothetical protein
MIAHPLESETHKIPSDVDIRAGQTGPAAYDMFGVYFICVDPFVCIGDLVIISEKRGATIQASKG